MYNSHNNNNNIQNNTTAEQNSSDSIMWIQRNLRQLSYHDDDIYSVGIDGVWGRHTTDSLKSFQRKYGLPQTGVADMETWELLRNVSKKSREFNSPTNAIKVFPRYPDDYFWDRESSPIQIQILQYVLNELSTEYGFGDIELSGIYDDNTQNAVIMFQEKNGLDKTGKVDRVTWNLIAEQYNLIADRGNR